MAQPTNKWFQSVFWPISCLPSFQHIPKHAADDYVGRTSPLLGTAFAFWICAAGAIALYLITHNILIGDLAWRGDDTAFSVVSLILLVLYLVGFWLFANREEDYPN
jgi:hypothetical protein